MAHPIFVLATFKAKPGKEAESETLFKSVLPLTHQEAGCLMYTCHKRTDQPGTYYFIEKWRSQADLDAHLKSSYISAALGRADELFTVADIGFIEALSGGDPAKNSL